MTPLKPHPNSLSTEKVLYDKGMTWNHSWSHGGEKERRKTLLRMRSWERGDDVMNLWNRSTPDQH
jgi:hypothetical protein